MSGQFGIGAKVSYGHFSTSAEMSWVLTVLDLKSLYTWLHTTLMVSHGLCVHEMSVDLFIFEALISCFQVQLHGG